MEGILETDRGIFYITKVIICNKHHYLKLILDQATLLFYFKNIEYYNGIFSSRSWSGEYYHFKIFDSQKILYRLGTRPRKPTTGYFESRHKYTDFIDKVKHTKRYIFLYGALQYYVIENDKIRYYNDIYELDNGGYFILCNPKFDSETWNIIKNREVISE